MSAKRCGLLESEGISPSLGAPKPRNLLEKTRKLTAKPACWLHSQDSSRSVRWRPEDKMDAGSFGERSKVSVSREECNAYVDAALGNQRVA